MLKTKGQVVFGFWKPPKNNDFKQIFHKQKGNYDVPDLHLLFILAAIGGQGVYYINWIWNS